MEVDATFSNPSTTPKGWTFKLLRWVQRNPLITFEQAGEFG
jgi:hypothetical protein